MEIYVNVTNGSPYIFANKCKMDAKKEPSHNYVCKGMILAFWNSKDWESIKPEYFTFTTEDKTIEWGRQSLPNFFLRWEMQI